MKTVKLFAVMSLVFAVSHAPATTIATFDSKDTGEDGYYRPAEAGTYDWTDAGMTFNLEVQDDGWGGTYWEGFTYSSVNNPDEGGWGNQYAVYQPGTDVSGTGVYAVGYVGIAAPTITFESPAQTQGLYANNTAFAAWDMWEGSMFSNEFESGDWFMLTITGLDSLGETIRSVDFYLADFTGYQDGDDKDDYIVSEWTWVDLTGLGSQVASLQFVLSSSDVGEYGMNTPAYFAIDNVTIIPEPSVLALLMVAAMGLLMRRRRW